MVRLPLGPLIAIVGRPNVGKSTLFNQLTRSRSALVHNQPGITRDRQYGCCDWDLLPFPLTVIDTGGVDHPKTPLEQCVNRQVEEALEAATVIVWVVDGKAGLHPTDLDWAKRLHQLGKPVVVAVNKVERQDPTLVLTDFYTSGFLTLKPISAAHGQGLSELLEAVIEAFKMLPLQDEQLKEGTAAESRPLHLAIIGRPNVGKSTLINRLLGEERVIVFDKPGTTRDRLLIPTVHHGVPYVLIDTAGVRRKSSVRGTSDPIEPFSVIKTLEAIQMADVVVFVLDAREGIVDQDIHLLSHIESVGKATIIAINKWDGLDELHREQVKRDLRHRLSFMDHVERRFISALHGTGVGLLWEKGRCLYEKTEQVHPTAELTRLLEGFVGAHEPPLVKGRRIKLRYAHLGGNRPLVIVIHGNQTYALPAHYKKYLTKCYRKALGLEGIPIRLVFKTGGNPYAPT